MREARVQTFGSVLDRHRGIGPGFDFMRVALAMSILFTHSFLIAQGEHHQFDGPVKALFHDSLVMGFFGLSGFLITGSALRLKLKDFLLNRGLRIFPALAVDIFVSALIIGPIFTVLPLTNYMRGYEFRAYFANIISIIHYTLPGVFSHNPFPGVINGSLWTVPFEFGCYAIMSLMMITGMLKQKITVIVFTIFVAVTTLAFVISDYDPLMAFVSKTSGIHNLVDHYFSRKGTPLYTYFLAGSLIFLFRHSIPYSRWAIFSAAAISVLVDAFVQRSLGQAQTTLLLAPLIMYIVLGLGLTPLPKLPLFSRGDYSYGIYLYGFPLQQALTQVFPFGGSPWINFGMSAALVTLVAMISWHLVEKPILNLRRKFSYTAQKGEQRQTLPDAQAVIGLPDQARPILPEAIETSVPRGRPVLSSG